MWGIGFLLCSSISENWHYLIFICGYIFLHQLIYLKEEKAKVIQTLLFVSGLNTLLQTWFGTRLPAVIGGSHTFVAPTISIILSGRWSDPDPISVCDLDPIVVWSFGLLACVTTLLHPISGCGTYAKCLMQLWYEHMLMLVKWEHMLSSYLQNLLNWVLFAWACGPGFNSVSFWYPRLVLHNFQGGSSVMNMQ